MLRTSRDENRTGARRARVQWLRWKRAASVIVGEQRGEAALPAGRSFSRSFRARRGLAV
jgi:hypothetical protein